MAAEDKKGELVPTEESSFNLPALNSPEEVQLIMQENMEGMTPRFDRIKIPSGGGLAFEVPTESGTDIMKELVGVIVDHYPVNVYWENEFTGQGVPPDCIAMDGRTGIGKPGGDCLRCPLNRFGSGKKGRGKACKNTHRIYIIQEGELFPTMLTLPPGTLGNFTNYASRLTKRMTPLVGCVTKISLQKDRNEDGIEFSRATFTKDRDLTPQETQLMRAYAETVRAATRKDEFEVGDYDEVDGTPSEGQPF